MEKEMELMRMCEQSMAMIVSSPPQGDEWAEIGMSESGGDVTIRAVAKGGEPHFISVSVRGERGKVRIERISYCEHLEGFAERILADAGG
jgi:hypothetical protein